MNSAITGERLDTTGASERQLTTGTVIIRTGKSVFATPEVITKGTWQIKALFICRQNVFKSGAFIYGWDLIQLGAFV